MTTKKQTAAAKALAAEKTIAAEKATANEASATAAAVDEVAVNEDPFASDVLPSPKPAFVIDANNAAEFPAIGPVIADVVAEHAAIEDAANEAKAIQDQPAAEQRAADELTVVEFTNRLTELEALQTGGDFSRLTHDEQSAINEEATKVKRATRVLIDKLAGLV